MTEEDMQDLDEIVSGIQESTSVDLSAVGGLQMLIRDKCERLAPARQCGVQVG